jgi:hypothetical protein
LIRKKRKEALKGRLASESQSIDAALNRDWRIVEGAVVGKGLFRKPELNLSMLSRATGIPKNRISMVVNAGFNSKATFYNWIKKYLNESPSEYLRRLRSDTHSSEFSGEA